MSLNLKREPGFLETLLQTPEQLQQSQQAIFGAALGSARAGAAHEAATVTALSSAAGAFQRDRDIDDAPFPALSRALRRWLAHLEHLTAIEEEVGLTDAAEDTRQLIAEIRLEFNLDPDDA